MFKRRRFSRRRRDPTSAAKGLVRTARNAAATRKIKNSMCRSLGTAYPGCLVTKFRLHGLWPLGTAGVSLSNGTTATDKYYGTITVPLTPHKFSSAFANVAGLTANTATPPGMSRLFGASGTGLYESGCCIRVSLIMKYYLWKVDGTSYVLPVGTPWNHFHHLRDNSQDALPDCKTQALCDTAYCQPDVARKVKGRISSMWASTGASGAGADMGQQAFVWKRVISPNVVLDQPFSTFLGQDASFSSSSADPANFAILDLAGFSTSLAGALLPEAAGMIEIDAVFTMVLKDPYSNI